MTTRTKILKAAEELFTERGYHATTLREVAERVGITKPALYYHFESKSEILASLLNPMTTELEQVLADAVRAGQTGGPPAMRRALLTGWLDVFLGSRGALLALFRDLAAMPPALYHRLLVVLERAVTLGAGATAKTADQVAMAQAISAITDPVALVPHIPTEELREHLLTGVWRLIGEPPGDAPSPEPAANDPAERAPAQETHPRPTEPIPADPSPERSTQPVQPATSPPPTSDNHPTLPAPTQSLHHGQTEPTSSEPQPNHSTQPNPATTSRRTPAPASGNHSAQPPPSTNRTPTSANHPAQPASTTSRNHPSQQQPAAVSHPTGPSPTHVSNHAQSAAGAVQRGQPRARRGGRPKALSPAEAAQVRELHASGEHNADSIAALLGVSRATIYRCLKTQF